MFDWVLDCVRMLSGLGDHVRVCLHMCAYTCVPLFVCIPQQQQDVAARGSQRDQRSMARALPYALRAPRVRADLHHRLQVCAYVRVETCVCVHCMYVCVCATYVHRNCECASARKHLTRPQVVLGTSNLRKAIQLLHPHQHVHLHVRLCQSTCTRGLEQRALFRGNSAGLSSLTHQWQAYTLSEAVPGALPSLWWRACTQPACCAMLAVPMRRCWRGRGRVVPLV